jgi:hypothetical protein
MKICCGETDWPVVFDEKSLPADLPVHSAGALEQWRIGALASAAEDVSLLVPRRGDERVQLGLKEFQDDAIELLPMLDMGPVSAFGKDIKSRILELPQHHEPHVQRTRPIVLAPYE